jgi:hypothetical protein
MHTTKQHQRAGKLFVFLAVIVLGPLIALVTLACIASM